jgi:hypothetical protein
VVKRAVAEYLKQHPLERVADTADHSDDQQPTETKLAAATKAKRGKTDKR